MHQDLTPAVAGLPVFGERLHYVGSFSPTPGADTPSATARLALHTSVQIATQSVPAAPDRFVSPVPSRAVSSVSGRMSGSCAVTDASARIKNAFRPRSFGLPAAAFTVGQPSGFRSPRVSVPAAGPRNRSRGCCAISWRQFVADDPAWHSLNVRQEVIDGFDLVLRVLRRKLCPSPVNQIVKIFLRMIERRAISGFAIATDKEVGIESDSAVSTP